MISARVKSIWILTLLLALAGGFSGGYVIFKPHTDTLYKSNPEKFFTINDIRFKLPAQWKFTKLGEWTFMKKEDEPKQVSAEIHMGYGDLTFALIPLSIDEMKSESSAERSYPTPAGKVEFALSGKHVIVGEHGYEIQEIATSSGSNSWEFKKYFDIDLLEMLRSADLGSDV